MTSTPESRDATKQAVLTALAGVICFALAEWWGLLHANLAVWTTFMVMAQYAFTRFQKGVERVIGRGVGILAGLILTTWFNEAALLAYGLMAVILTICFYLFFAGRLAYTFLNAGLYVVAVFHIGHANPLAAVPEAEELFAAVVLGVVVADAVLWTSGAEHDLGIQFGTEPLWPIRGPWLSQSLMLTVTVSLTVFGSNLVGLNPENAAISVMVLTVSPHLQALILKGELRIVGLLLATLWGLITFSIVGFLPYLPLLGILLFLGLFIATYISRTAGAYAYAGVQMGLVLPMVIVAPPMEFGTIAPAIQRLEGILVALLTSVLVAALWPRFPGQAPVIAAVGSSPSGAK